MIKLILSLLCIVVLFHSCSNKNKLKTDEHSLVKQILTEEEQLAHEQQLRAEREKQLADSLAKLPKGFRFKEERGVDPEHPPMVIDIAGSLENFKSFKLSDFASKIDYIRIEQPEDSVFHPKMKFNYLMLDDYIVASNLYGIVLYTRKGEFVTNVVCNKSTGITYQPEKNMITTMSSFTRIGAGFSLWNEGNELFYTYVNNISGQQFIMKLDCSNIPVSMSTVNNPETPDAIIGKGNIDLDFNHGLPPPMVLRKNATTELLDRSRMKQTMSSYRLDNNTYIQFLSGENMFAIFGNSGDTLATFSKNEQVKNYTKSIMRGVDRGFTYQKNGKHYFRTDYNDTIFQIIPPNRLFPVYVLNLGEHKVEKQDGVDPGVSLEGKIIPSGFAVFNKHIFINFLKDNYDCPNNRRNKLVKKFYGVFDIANEKLELVPADSLDYSPNILENDIDGGLPVWPSTYNSDKGNEILIPVFGHELKQHVNSDKYLHSNAPEEKKSALKKLSEEVADHERILMVIK
ncbi:DUF4933 domain-containing protein [Maribellus sediminis]|uniref:DUF4933 domain-containing protein n=1 Tax=Maribellus sediminis TaxID=2696285 RepID=UPI0014315D41|nr:DUF4933 domain-containing protein [Maribellus sediminis]